MWLVHICLCIVSFGWSQLCLQAIQVCWEICKSKSLYRHCLYTWKAPVLIYQLHCSHNFVWWNWNLISDCSSCSWSWTPCTNTNQGSMWYRPMIPRWHSSRERAHSVHTYLRKRSSSPSQPIRISRYVLNSLQSFNYRFKQKFLFIGILIIS